LGLLLALNCLSAPLRFTLFAAHFNHQLRKESAAEAAIVRDICRSENIPFFDDTAPVAELSERENLEACARRLRYDFFRRVAKENGAAKIATAHHGNDQTETLLMHLIRGCGAEGLAAIAPIEGNIIRPFLSFDKDEIMRFCAFQGIKYATDKSNFCDIYTRNHLRMNIIPLLEKINPQTAKALRQTAELCREENACLHSMALRAFDEASFADGEALRGSIITKLPLALQRRVLRIAYEKYALAANKRREKAVLSFYQTEMALSLKENALLPLPEGIWLRREKGDWFFYPSRPQTLSSDESMQLKTGALIALPFGNWQYEAKAVSADESADLLRCGLDENCFLAPLKLKDKLFFRSRCNGDFIHPRGMKGRKKVKNIFIDAKIPLRERASWPLLIWKHTVLWVPLLRRGETPGHKAHSQKDGEFLLVKVSRQNTC
jgi:tRNA(Ile)-lysidine synthase